jgi:hypothetical protein
MAWQDKQIWTLGKYRKMAKLPDAEYRVLLHEVTGCSLRPKTRAARMPTTAW